jgi:signal transduction histidine kinase
VVSRWRIRHKLLLGVCSVAAIMALLLGGTLRGLYSYYLTINNIRELQTERKAVEEFQGAVFDLESREEPSADDGADPAAGPRDAMDAVFADFVRLPEKIDAARKKLAAYEELLKDAASRGRDPADVELQSKTVRALQGNFDDLEKAAESLSEAVAVSLGGNKDVADRLRRKIGGQLKTLRCNAKDLCTNVHDDVDRRLNESRSHYQVTLWIVVPTSVVGLLILIGLLRSFYAWVFHPIRDLEIGVGRVARGDFSKPIEVHSGDEMEDLAAAFNDMMKRLRDLYDNLAQQVNERSRQLVRSERLASVGFLAAGVAHEINNPLASIAFCSEALESRLADLLEQLRASGRGGDDPEVFTRYLRMIQEEAFRCKHITERLLAFSRTGERRREPTDLGKLVQSVLDVTQGHRLRGDRRPRPGRADRRGRQRRGDQVGGAEPGRQRPGQHGRGRPPDHPPGPARGRRRVAIH